MSSDRNLLDIEEARKALGQGALSGSALTARCLSAIDRYNPVLNAFITVSGDQALVQAEQHDVDLPLSGMPYAVKDNIDTAGIRTTAASRLLLENVPGENAEVIASANGAGAILLGKLNTYEFGTGTGAVYPDLAFPVARNPWDTARFSGGSSTGAGVAVAAGLAMFAIGTDTGGSVRLPAAACGVVGLKPTFGAISTVGMQPNCPSLDHVGPLTRSVADARTVFAALRRRDREAQTRSSPGGKLRVGYVRRFHEQDVTCAPEIAQGLEDAATMFRDAGAELVELSLPYGVLDYRACSRLLNVSECFSIHQRVHDEHLDVIGAALRDKLFAGSQISVADYIRARRWRSILAAAVDALFQHCDVLLCLGTPMLPPLLANADQVTAYTTQSAMAVFNVSGHPALSMCPGLSSGGLPLNIQLAARYHDEASLFAAAGVIEQAAGRFSPPLERLVAETEVAIATPLPADRSRERQREANEAALRLMPRYLPETLPPSLLEGLT
jgi:aspartyl-tRNA(Asn)/glutamyl-tRNA(Gln) amidotransferase subunit A